MEETASGTLSIPIRVIVQNNGSSREEFLRLLKEDETVQQAVRSLLANNSSKQTASMLPLPQKEPDAVMAASPQQTNYFLHGLEVFPKYKKLNETIREQFSNVFRHDEDFEAFICCGAQKDAPQEIWDGIKRCLGTANPGELDVLKNMLSCCIELVNRTFPTPKFQWMTLKVGDDYNDSLHSIYGTNSKKQGNVAQVFLPGMTCDNECIRKSLVRLE